MAAENLFLRKQLALFEERKVQPHRATHAVRFVMSVLGGLFDWRSALRVVNHPLRPSCRARTNDQAIPRHSPFVGAPASGADADMILHNGKIATVDPAFHVVEAIAVKNGRITAAGPSNAVLHAERTPRTRVVDLAGKAVLPGLIDAHVHALEAGLSEFRAPPKCYLRAVAVTRGTLTAKRRAGTQTSAVGLRRRTLRCCPC